MAVTGWTSHSRSGASHGVRGAARALGALALVALILLVVRASTAAQDAGVTSDESLYLSEAVSIADGRLEYASGDAIVHRPPLYPAMLAPVVKLGANDIGDARIVPIACALGAVAALAWLTALLFGRRAAFAAVVLAATAATPARLAPAFFVDTPAAMLLLASAAAMVTASRSEDRTFPWWAASGAALGLSFLMKETAILWLPLPVLYLLTSAPDARRSVRAAAAFYTTFALLAAPWFAWVAWHTNTAFKLDGASAALALAAIAALVVAAAAWRWRVFARPRPVFAGQRIRTATALCLLAAWSLLMLFVLESRPEPHPTDYLRSVPRWTATVFATGVEPLPFVAAAWLFVAWRGIRGDASARLPLLLVALGMPLYVYAANRGWELRQAIWLVYLSYAVLAWALAEAASAVASRWRWGLAERDTLTAALVVAVALIAGFASGFGPAGTDAAADWRSADEQEFAGWLTGLPPGSTVLASRMYASQLYVDTGGDLRVRQLPTLGATLARDGAVRPFGTLFRYEDATTDLDTPRNWIALRPHAGRAYAIGLAEEDLLASIRQHGAGYLLITGDDAGASSTAYLAYLDEHPAFTLLRRKDETRASLYRVDRSMLAARRAPLALSGDDFAYVIERAGVRAGDEAFWRTLAPNGVLLDGQRLDARDLAAVSGAR